MKLYTVEIKTKDKKEYLFSTGENEIEAMDKIVEHYKNDLKQEIIDIKVV